MKLLFVSLMLCILSASPAFARGGHRGTFYREAYDQVTRERLVIEIKVGRPLAKNPADRVSYTRIISRDGKPEKQPRRG